MLRFPMITHTEPAVLEAPLDAGITRHFFRSSFDGSSQTFLLKDFRPSETSECPLAILYLHGALAHEDQGMTCGIYGNAFGKWASEFAARQAIYLCPEYRGGSWMGPAAESDLRQIVVWLRSRYAPRKVILTGGSMGGTSALIFGARHAELLDGIIALCPASDTREMYPAFPEQFQASYGGTPEDVPEEYLERSVRIHPGKLAALPVAMVHGTADPVIPVHHSRQLAERIGNNPWFRAIEMEGGDHDAPLSHPLPPLLDFVLKSQTNTP